MKSISTFACCLILLASSSLNAQIRMGIQAGSSLSKWKIKGSQPNFSTDFNPGITAGLFIKIPIRPHLSIEPAFNFVQKGYFESDSYSSEKLILNYLELPVNFVYRLEERKGVFIGAGLSFAYGLSGKDKYVDKTDPSLSDVEKVQFGSGETKLKHGDLGINFLAGYQLTEKIGFTLNCNLGLTDIHDFATDEKITVKNNYFAVRIGYTFLK